MSMLFKRVIILAILAFGMLSCDRDTDFIITIETPYGEMKAFLYDQTPKHKENFLKLANEGKFDSTLFYRVINEFMIQGGDINAKNGFENSINYTVPAEFDPALFHRKGALAAARQMDRVNPAKASSGSQFYVVQGKVWKDYELTTDMNKLNNALARLIRMQEYDSLGKSLISIYESGDYEKYNNTVLELVPLVTEKTGLDVSKYIQPERLRIYTTIGGYPWLDDQYTVFGQVISGLDVIDKIASLPVGEKDRPLEDVMMKVSVEEMSKKQITKKYGVIYPDTKK